MTPSLTLPVALLASLLPLGAALAETDTAPALRLELNSLTPQEGGCRLTLLASNDLGRDLDGLVLETVLFNTEGAVERLSLFDLQSLPAGRPRVRQFDLPGLSCTALSAVLINGISSCTASTGPELTPGDCLKALELTTKTEIEVLG